MFSIALVVALAARTQRLPVCLCDRGAFTNSVFRKLLSVTNDAVEVNHTGDGGYQPSVEYIAALEPDGVFRDSHINIGVRLRFRQLGPSVADFWRVFACLPYRATRSMRLFWNQVPLAVSSPL